MRDTACVGALVRDDQHRVFVHRRAPGRRLLPGAWDIVGGHIEPGETPQAALAREVEEETGWKLRRIEAVIADWEWEHGGVVRRELDYLVEVSGDRGAPRLERGKHDACAWVGPGDLELMMEGRAGGDRRLRGIVAKATRIRLTDRLRLEPIGPEHAGDLWRLHQDEAVATWYAGRWTAQMTQERAAGYGAAWEADGVSKWLAYDRGTGEMVGRGGLSRVNIGGRDRLEAGWTVRGDLWGRGYATEIGRAGLAFAWDDCGGEEVIAFTEIQNRRSRAVMERLGMTYNGPFDLHGMPFVLYTITRAAERGIGQRT